MFFWKLCMFWWLPLLQTHKLVMTCFKRILSPYRLADIIPIILLFYKLFSEVLSLSMCPSLWLKDFADSLNRNELILLTSIRLTSTFLLNSAVVLTNLLNFDSIFCLFISESKANVLKLFFRFYILLFCLYEFKLSFDLSIF